MSSFRSIAVKTCSCAGWGMVLAAGAAPAQTPMPEVLVLASQLRETAVAEVPTSLSVLDEESIAAASLQHFEELSFLVPNLNWSGEGSRARYFQIRGTGELEQYEGAPNPSVGVIVDDIDLSAIGGAATTFDTARIEVLRGPQGTRYGANALAGLIYIQSADPSPEAELRVEATAGSDDTRALGVVAGGAVPGTGEDLSWRVAIQQYESDGFRNNAFLGRDDTYGRDELTARAKLRWAPSEALVVQLTGLHVNLDNGYDAFAIDNGYTTQSDKPGRDAQKTNAAALRAELALGQVATLVSITGLAHSDIDFSFDADWGNDEFWAPHVYDFTQAFARKRNTLNQEFRLVSAPGGRLFGADWVVGAYALDLDERNARRDAGICGASACGEEFTLDTSVRSDYDALSLALFGELSVPIGDRTTLVAGLRREERDADYVDDAGARFDARDRMTGGELTLRHRFDHGVSAYGRIARGYKAGGFNPGLAGIDFDEFPDFNVGAENLQFDPEYLWNYEAGLHFVSPRASWSANLSVFHQDRRDMQVKIPAQLRAGDPTTFVFFTDNARSGQVRGAELEWSWQPVAALTLGGSLGLLHTEIEDFATRPELEGREFAHAPEYTFALNATWRSTDGWYVRGDLTGKDRFTFDYCQTDDCRDPRSQGYSLVNLRAGRAWDRWQVELWVRNLADEDYAVRGFFFGNEPPAFEPALYTRLGDPRHAGVTVNYRL